MGVFIAGKRRIMVCTEAAEMVGGLDSTHLLCFIYIEV